MGNVMISLNEEDERLLRELARLYGGKKGSLSAVVASGIGEVAKKEKRRRMVDRQLMVMREGFDFGLKGNKAYEKRGDVYD